MLKAHRDQIKLLALLLAFMFRFVLLYLIFDKFKIKIIRILLACTAWSNSSFLRSPPKIVTFKLSITFEFSMLNSQFISELPHCVFKFSYCDILMDVFPTKECRRSSGNTGNKQPSNLSRRLFVVSFPTLVSIFFC